MICPHCSFDIQGNQQVCPQCYIPLPAPVAANVASGVSNVVAARSIQSSIKEKRHNWIWLGGIGAIITGIAFLGSGGGGVLLALLAIAAGIATLTISKFGKEWDNLPGSKKAAVVPGIVVGIGLLVVGYMFLYALWYAFKIEFLKG